MPIKPSDIDKFTRVEGEAVWHESGLPCFCRDSKGQLDPNCSKHDWTGRVYRDKKRIKAIVSGLNNHKELIQAGIALPGDCVLSPQSGDVVAAGDKITFTWPEPYGDGEVLTRGTSSGETLLYAAVKSIYLGDENGIYYKQDRDFRFVDKEIQWTWTDKPSEGKKPRTGVRYAIQYKGYLEYVAFDIPVERVSAGKDIGSKVLLRKLHLAH